MCCLCMWHLWSNQHWLAQLNNSLHQMRIAINSNCLIQCASVTNIYPKCEQCRQAPWTTLGVAVQWRTMDKTSSRTKMTSRLGGGKGKKSRTRLTFALIRRRRNVFDEEIRVGIFTRQIQNVLLCRLWWTNKQTKRVCTLDWCNFVCRRTVEQTITLITGLVASVVVSVNVSNKQIGWQKECLIKVYFGKKKFKNNQISLEKLLCWLHTQHSVVLDIMTRLVWVELFKQSIRTYPLMIEVIRESVEKQRWQIMVEYVGGCMPLQWWRIWQRIIAAVS